jgi:hypothetical protein
MAMLEQLRSEYQNSGFTVDENVTHLVFSKNYPFEDKDGHNKEVLIEVSFSKEYPILPPQLYDPGHILSSMHSLNGFQCWARFSDIFPQIGLGLIAPNFVETQISKLIEAHKNQEYYTLYESPEFASLFEARKTVDHQPFYVTCEVLESAAKAGRGKIISSMAHFNGYLWHVDELPSAVDASSHIIPPTKYDDKNRRIFFLNIPAILHYDYRIDDAQFLYWLELNSGITIQDMFLQNIADDIFVSLIFFNKGICSYNIVVFNKKNDKLFLLRHARVSSRSVLFCRHANESMQISNKKVAVIGVGAIGSVIALNLLQSGIDTLYIADNDYVDLENTSRSIYYANNVGERKIDAFKKCAGLKDPDFYDRVLIYDSIDDVQYDNVDISIFCIGDIYKEYEISRRMRKIGYEKNVFVFGQNDSTWGGIYFQDDTSLGCQHCLMLHQSERVELQIPYVPYFSDAVGCGKPSYISTPTDISLIASLASKLIIDRLIKQQKTGPNYFIWQSSPEPTAWKDSHPDRFSLKKYRVTKHEKCEC